MTMVFFILVEMTTPLINADRTGAFKLLVNPSLAIIINKKHWKKRTVASKRIITTKQPEITILT